MAASIEIIDVTEGTLTGAGSYDKFIAASLLHLRAEYDAERISGEDYATVYLGIIQSAMAQSIQFELQRQNAAAQVDLINQQTANAVKEGLGIEANTALTEQQRLNAVVQAEVLNIQKDKLLAEKDLLTQKKFTEEAQTKDTVDGSVVAGSIGKQKSLYAAQTAGFTRDAEQKAAKIVADAYAVRKSADSSASTPEGLVDTSITEVINVLKSGVGIPIVP